MQELKNMPKFTKRNLIDGIGFKIDKAFVKRIENYFKEEKSALAMDFRVVLNFKDHEPVLGYIIAYKQGYFTISTKSLAEMD